MTHENTTVKDHVKQMLRKLKDHTALKELADRLEERRRAKERA